MSQERRRQIPEFKREACKLAIEQQICSADITYIPTEEGWLYLALVEDRYSRKIVGWSLSKRIDSRLVVDALQMAVPGSFPKPARWLIRIAAGSMPANTTRLC
jgi:transposase InsO family protein